MHYDFEFKYLDIMWYISVCEFIEEESFHFDIIGAWFIRDDIPVPNELFDYLTNQSSFDSVVLDRFLDINGRTL